MDNLFDIDFNKLIAERIPIRMRMPGIMAFVAALSAEVNKEYQKFRTNRDNNLYRLGITPQVCYLEKMLNDKYDFISRRIYITDGVDKPITYIYKEEESKPVYLGSKFIYTDGETTIQSDDFIIWVPNSLVFEQKEMISMVEGYKLAGTTFKIQRI